MSMAKEIHHPDRAQIDLVGLFALVPAVADAVQVPVVAAGGIADARGIAAALTLGASAAQIGTGFLRCPEAKLDPVWADALATTQPEGTMVSRAFSGKTMRVLRNRTTDHFEAHPEELKKFPEQLFVSHEEGTFHLGGDETTKGVDPRREGYPAGQAVGAINELVPAGELVRHMVAEAEVIFARLSSL